MSTIPYKRIIFLVIALIVLFLWKPVKAEAPKPAYTKPLSVKETIVKYAVIYAAPEKELVITAQCESQFNQKAIGDKGKAVGIFQYHKPTFDRFAKLMGEELDYHSYDDQAKLTAWVFVHYPQYKSHWTCYTKNFK